VALAHGTGSAIDIDFSDRPELDSAQGRVCKGLKELHADRKKFCDLKFKFAGHEAAAHRAVLIAASHGFAECIDEWENKLESMTAADAGGDVACDAGLETSKTDVESGYIALEQVQSGLAILVVHFDSLLGVTSPEAVEIVMAHAYGADGEEVYNPQSSQANKDVLQMCDKFKLDQLKERAIQWMSRAMTEDRIIEWLEVCDKFRLMDLMDHILETLTTSEKGLQCLERQSSDFAKVPWISHELLRRTSNRLSLIRPADEVPTEPPPPDVNAKSPRRRSRACVVL
jgi:hypothetical protein